MTIDLWPINKILSIHLIDGDFDNKSDLYIADVSGEDAYSVRSLPHKAGLHIGSEASMATLGIRRRSADIIVVRQYRAYLTMAILFHELCHALVWLCYLPGNVNASAQDCVEAHLTFPRPKK